MARKSKKKSSAPSMSSDKKNIIAGLILLFLGLVGFFSDPGSVVGAFLSPLLVSAFGEWAIWIFAPVLILLGLFVSIKRASWNATRFVGILLYWLSVEGIIGFFTSTPTGFFDFHVSVIGIFGKVMTAFVFIAALLFSLYLIFRISYIKILSGMRENLPSVGSIKDGIRDLHQEFKSDMKPDAKTGKTTKAQKGDIPISSELERVYKEIEELKKASSGSKEKEKDESQKKMEFGDKRMIPIEKKDKKDSKGFFGLFDSSKDEEDDDVEFDGKVKVEIKEKKNHDFSGWEFPPTKLLNNLETNITFDEKVLAKKSELIRAALGQFKIEVEMRGYQAGPTVIQYRLKPSEGVKLNRIENLKKDLTLALHAKSIRIQAPIPGLGLVGVEVPNDDRQAVGIREVIEDRSFTGHKSNLAMVVGKDINGDHVVCDLAKMPHLLIAGQTGSGKSVGMNGFLVSLLYKNSPETLRLLMVDPKRVELGVYNGIPHLLAPVINTPDKALNALKWAVAEMMRRYDLLQQAGCRNLGEFNTKKTRKDRMPNIVIVIDELADLMMSSSKKDVENCIVRIAQMARAVGMHLLVATQRPSVDVITGLIKANIPSRIAFTVASQVDSRTILDKIGAEDLLGKGDMLYSPSGTTDPMRVQGVLVETEEVEAVVNHIKRTIDPAMLEDMYDMNILEPEQDMDKELAANAGEDYNEDDKVLAEAIKIVREAKKASTSMLQRRLKLGYSRAARIIDIMEEMGIVGPADGSKPRDVL